MPWTEYRETKDDVLWMANTQFARIEDRSRLLRHLLYIDRMQQDIVESILRESVYLLECPRHPPIHFAMCYTQDSHPYRLYGNDILKHLQKSLSVVLPLDFLHFLLCYSHRLALKQPNLQWDFRFTSPPFLFLGPEETWRHFRLLNLEEYVDPDFEEGIRPSHVLYNRRNPNINASWKVSNRKLLVISQSTSGDRLLLDVTHPDSSTFGWIYAHSNHPLVFNTHNPQFLDFSITDLMYRITSNDQMKLKTIWFHNLFDKPNRGCSMLHVNK
ncbi:hypothetical protein K493DRAFT_305850 [Basidiobolus meristosporus CBS 931.73]|uniref:Uncharacterized protein n=1 Tax=Basidiobolus meristosporus CBS 931.73 TaxID=1314790 RepID=A0A1Y1XUB4_9FUNG|nr:hypothetical protein K493DRAFT_305850 [Basidiobolus meristosporus CBS 931.73]|eukprot:ORX89351.1 hypothetical protein K493DRAFT_305850 [Basidiobolus meristosporus CBS 931.73]